MAILTSGYLPETEATRQGTGLPSPLRREYVRFQDAVQGHLYLGCRVRTDWLNSLSTVLDDAHIEWYY